MLKALATVVAVAIVLSLKATESEASPARFTLWQLPEQTHSQMMSYVIQTSQGTVIVIDGGVTGDAPYLRQFLNKLGGRVEAWFLSHPHSDHHEALVDILARPDGITVNRLYASLPPDQWFAANEPQWAKDVLLLRKTASDAGKCFSRLLTGQLLLFDGVRVEVLAVANPEITANAVNNSSVVLKFSDSAKSVLFLGDLGPEGGEKLLKGPMSDRLPSDYVQMAHHGQNGVGEAVYQKIRPKYCLWTTPTWLWNNDNGGGTNSGPWKTLEVRAWMDALDIKRHYVTSIDGLVKIE